MNERLIEFLLRSEVANLPKEKQSLYKFIVDAEDSLVDIAETVDEFQQLLVKHSPYEQAVHHFNIPFKEIVYMMDEIETELNMKVSKRCEKVEWIDYTDQFSRSVTANNSKRIYLFIN